ncbi:hypothetical protein [Brevundimonas sp.]|uniref:hypothetical protein n=1 Tax=Brevundimonas sp. TaxID=1871086 RepID=UPI0025BCCFD0|nr:hypothetical protein [Brevundimonas sp.]
MIRRILLTTAVIGSIGALAACNPPEPAAPPAEPAPAPAPEVPAPAPSNVLTANGFGPLRIGMTTAEIEAALGADSNPNAVGGADPASCDMFHPARAPEGLLVMTNGGALASVWLTRASTVTTDRGFKIGDEAAAVKAAYGASAVVVPHKYEAAPAEYITVWATADHAGPAARGVKYEIGQDGKVKSIAGGGPSIEYVEGCS